MRGGAVGSSVSWVGLVREAACFCNSSLPPPHWRALSYLHSSGQASLVWPRLGWTPPRCALICGQQQPLSSPRCAALPLFPLPIITRSCAPSLRRATSLRAASSVSARSLPRRRLLILIPACPPACPHSAACLRRACAAGPRRRGDLPVRRSCRAAPRLCAGRRDGAAGEQGGGGSWRVDGACPRQPRAMEEEGGGTEPSRFLAPPDVLAPRSPSCQPCRQRPTSGPWAGEGAPLLLPMCPAPLPPQPPRPRRLQLSLPPPRRLQPLAPRRTRRCRERAIPETSGPV